MRVVSNSSHHAFECLIPPHHQFVVPCFNSPLFPQSFSFFSTFSKKSSKNTKRHSCESISIVRSCRWELIGNWAIWVMNLLKESIRRNHLSYLVPWGELFIPSIMVACVWVHIWKPHSWPSAIYQSELRNKLQMKPDMTGGMHNAKCQWGKRENVQNNGQNRRDGLWQSSTQADTIQTKAEAHLLSETKWFNAERSVHANMVQGMKCAAL